mgnify:CR=1 FL=1
MIARGASALKRATRRDRSIGFVAAATSLPASSSRKRRDVDFFSRSPERLGHLADDLLFELLLRGGDVVSRSETVEVGALEAGVAQLAYSDCQGRSIALVFRTPNLGRGTTVVSRARVRRGVHRIAGVEGRTHGATHGECAAGSASVPSGRCWQRTTRRCRESGADARPHRAIPTTFFAGTRCAIAARRSSGWNAAFRSPPCLFAPPFAVRRWSPRARSCSCPAPASRSAPRLAWLPTRGRERLSALHPHERRRLRRRDRPSGLEPRPRRLIRYSCRLGSPRARPTTSSSRRTSTRPKARGPTRWSSLYSEVASYPLTAMAICSLDAVEDRDLDMVTEPGETDRRLADTDGDGIDDGAEVANGTDPLDANDPAVRGTPARRPSRSRPPAGRSPDRRRARARWSGPAPTRRPRRRKYTAGLRRPPASRTIETCSGTNTSFDTVLYVRQSDCATGTQIACNDDTGSCATAEPNNHHRSRIQPSVTARRDMLHRRRRLQRQRGHSACACAATGGRDRHRDARTRRYAERHRDGRGDAYADTDVDAGHDGDPDLDYNDDADSNRDETRPGRRADRDPDPRQRRRR